MTTEQAGVWRTAGATCALEGCEVPITRQGGGGRPKRYCSDAHRALARRRRLRQGDAAPDDLATRAVEALRSAVLLVEEAVAAPSGLQAQLAEARAQATAQVLEAQRMAADATRELVEARRRFDEERRRLQAELAEGRDRAARDRTTITELDAALEGARAELKAELLRHHRDVRALEEERSRPGRAPRAPRG